MNSVLASYIEYWYNCQSDLRVNKYSHISVFLAFYGSTISIFVTFLMVTISLDLRKKISKK